MTEFAPALASPQGAKPHPTVIAWINVQLSSEKGLGGKEHRRGSNAPFHLQAGPSSILDLWIVSVQEKILFVDK